MNILERLAEWYLFTRRGWRLVYRGKRTASDGMTTICTVTHDRAEGLR